MRLPAEWEKQSGVQLTWPDETTPWYDLPRVQECYAEIASAILRFERLFIVCTDKAECRARLKEIADEKGLDLDLSSIRFFEAPINDTWARDHGAIAILGDKGEKFALDFVFNGWGLKFASNLDNCINRSFEFSSPFKADVKLVSMAPFVLEGGSIDSDGAGTLLTTKSCLCSVNRNDQLNQGEIEEELKAFFGLKRVIWLNHGSIFGDDTDGHVDIMARFCDAETIAYAISEDQASENYRPLKEMEKELKSLRTLDGKPYKLVPLPLPEQMWLEGYPLPASYVNFLIINGAVLVPGAGQPTDEIVRERLQAVFPEREIILIDCRPLLSGHGGLHCVTMNFPEGYLA
ncbi:MAG: agmatine deiminase family protein [Bacteroidales bacterium]|nr:agmatine deiminase family protein [Bacteroidales bacterium]